MNKNKKDFISSLFLFLVCTHHRVDSRVHTERRILGGERFACGGDEVRVARARPPLCNVLNWRMTSQCRVVWPAGGQEVRRLVSCHHLSCVCEDGGGEETEGVHA